MNLMPSAKGSHIRPLTRRRIVDSLPTAFSCLVLRECTRSDLQSLATWPSYAFPYHGFELSFRGMKADALDALFQKRQRDSQRITLTIDHSEESCIGYLALLDIDWEKRCVGNLSTRIHPSWCDRGIGTQIMQALLNWLFGVGFESLHLDVAASNTRAIRCYERVGFREKCELWRPAPDLAEADLSAPEFAFLHHHVRYSGKAPELRFLVMQISS